MPAVSLEGVSKRYKIFPQQRHRLVEALSFGRVKRSRDFWALKDVSLKVEPGTSLGLLGRNGAGKSTLLSLISGVLQPTSGSVTIDGRLVALLQLGAGFRPEYTGRENAMLNGLILGLDRREMLEKFDEIEAFVDIGEFMDQPVKTYSSGMRARLGFAVAISMEPDILLVDETLSVGDEVFRHQGMQKMRELRDSGATVLFVSHSLDMIRSFCTEAALLHQGRVIAQGDTSETLDRYKALISEIEAQRNARLDKAEGRPRLATVRNDSEAPETPLFKEDPSLNGYEGRELRHGTGAARIKNVELLDEHGKPVHEVAPESALTVRVHLRYAEFTEASAVRIILRNKAGLDVFSTTSLQEGVRLGPRGEGERLIVDFDLQQLPIKSGPYSVTAAIVDLRTRNLNLDWVSVAAVFKVKRPSDRGPIRGIVHLPTEVQVFSPSETQSSEQLS